MADNANRNIWDLLSGVRGPAVGRSAGVKTIGKDEVITISPDPVVLLSPVSIQQVHPVVIHDSPDPIVISDSPAAKVFNSPESKVRNSPESKVRNSPVSKVRNFPVSKVHNSPVSKVHNSPISKVCHSPIISKVRICPAVKVGHSPTSKLHDSSAAKVQNSPSSKVCNSPVSKVCKSPTSKVRNFSVAKVQNSPISKVSDSLVTKVLTSPLSQVHTSIASKGLGSEESKPRTSPLEAHTSLVSKVRISKPVERSPAHSPKANSIHTLPGSRASESKKLVRDDSKTDNVTSPGENDITVTSSAKKTSPRKLSPNHKSAKKTKNNLSSVRCDANQTLDSDNEVNSLSPSNSDFSDFLGNNDAVTKGDSSVKESVARDGNCVDYDVSESFTETDEEQVQYITDSDVTDTALDKSSGEGSVDVSPAAAEVPSVSLEKLRDKLKLGSTNKTSSSNQHAKIKDVPKPKTTKGSKVSVADVRKSSPNAEATKFPATNKKTGVASQRIVPGFNLFDRAAKGLLKATPSDVITSLSEASSRHRSVTMTTTSTHAAKDLSVQPLDLSKITPALKNVKQVSPPAPVKIDLTGEPAGELPLDLSTKKRPPEGAGEGSGVSPPKKARDSRVPCLGAALLGKTTVGDVYGGQCASCRASRLCTCSHKEGTPKPAHSHSHMHQSNLNSHLNAASNVQNVSEQNLNSGNGGGNNNASIISSGNNRLPSDPSVHTDKLAKPYVSTDNIVAPTRTGRYSPIELPKQRMTQTLKGQGIVNHRGRAFIVSPVRPQIKGQPVDASSRAALTSTVKTKNKAQTTASVPCISTTLDNVVSCKPNFDQKNTDLAPVQKVPEGIDGGKTTIVNSVHTDSTADFVKASRPLLSVPKYTPNVQKIKVKKNKKSNDMKDVKSEKKKLRKIKRENSVTDVISVSQSIVTKYENVSPESTSSIMSSSSSPDMPPGVRLPRHIMVARKSTRPHKPTRKVLEMVETSDFLESPTKTSPTKEPGSTDSSPVEGRRLSSGSRTREAGVSPELPAAGKIRTVPKKFTRNVVTQKGGRLGEKVTSPAAKVTSSTSPIKDDDVMWKRSFKKNLHVFMPTTSEAEASISPLRLNVLTTTSDSTFHLPVTKATEPEREVSDTKVQPCLSGLEEDDNDCPETGAQGTRFSLEPEHYTYPSDTEPHHILSCPDWREDLIRYKRERLHLPPKIISVPKHTQPNFKAPTYVEIPKCNRMFGNGANKKIKKSSSPPDTKSNSTIKLTITGPSITMHEYPEGTSPQKTVEKPLSPIPVQKSQLLNIPTAPENSAAPKSPVGCISNLAKLIQHKKELKKRSLKLGGGTKQMSPLMKKVHKELKRERHRIASCSPGRSSAGGKSPVRSESPGSASSLSPQAFPVRIHSVSGDTCGTSREVPIRNTHASDITSTGSTSSTGSQSPFGGSTGTPSGHRPASLDLNVTEMDVKNMTLEELGYEKVKPLVASPTKHFATSTMQKLAERLGISVGRGNGQIKPSRTVICNPATNFAPFTDLKDKLNKLRKKSKKKKKNSEEIKMKTNETEGVSSVAEDNAGKKKKSKKKKKDKKKKKLREKEREEAVAKSETKDEPNEEKSKEIKDKTKKQKISKGSQIKSMKKTSKGMKMTMEHRKEKVATKVKRDECPKKRSLKKVKNVQSSSAPSLRSKGPVKRGKMSKKQRLQEERRKQREEEEERKKRKRRSMLDELRNSEGYVAEKRFKKHENLLVDPSELGREERALQRAMMKIAEMEQQTSPPPNGTSVPPGGEQSAREKTTASNVKRAKANKALGLKKRAINSGRNKVYCEVMNGDARQTDTFSTPEKEETITPSKSNIECESKRKPGRPCAKRREQSEENSVQKDKGRRKAQENENSDSSEDSTSEPEFTISPEIQKPKRKIKSLTPCEGIRGRGRRRYNYHHQRSLMTLPDPAEPQSEITSSDIADLARQATLELHSSLSTADTLSVKDYSSFGDGSQFGDARPFKASASKYVMWKGKRLGATQKTGEKLLHKAARMGYEDVCLHCIQQCPEDVNAQENAGFTPLHEACSIGHIVIARMLLAHGANVNVCSHDGIRPLHDAIENDNIELARLLISCGADMNLGSFSGVPVMAMAKSDEMKQFLRGCMSDLNELRDETGKAWEFFGSSVTDELDSDVEENGVGCDVFDDVPSDSDVSCHANDVTFDFSDSVPPATIALCVDKDKGVANYIFFDDLLEHVGLSRYYFMRRHPDVRVLALPQKEWRKINREATKNQLDLPKTALETCRWRSYVELVEYDDDIKKILSVSTESLALNSSGCDVLYHVQGTETRTGNNRHNFLENADIKSEPLDDADFKLYDEEDIDMNYYCGHYDNEGNLDNDTSGRGYIDVENYSPNPGQGQNKVKIKSERVTDAISNRRTDSGTSWSVKKFKRTQISEGSGIANEGELGGRKNESNYEAAPLSPSFHRPWAMPPSPKAQPKPVVSQSSSSTGSGAGISHPAAKSPRLSSPVHYSPALSPVAQHMLHHPPHRPPSAYTLSPQPYLLNTPQRPEPPLSAGPYPFHQMSSPPALPLYPSYQSVARDYQHAPNPMRELPRIHHGYQGLPPTGYHGYHAASPSHAAGRMISLVSGPGMSPSPSPSLATITHEQQILPNVSVVTVEHLQSLQHLHHQVQNYHNPYHPR